MRGSEFQEKRENDAYEDWIPIPMRGSEVTFKFDAQRAHEGSRSP